eukprot:GHVO01044018.1.p1 GENE.GHVO01044018.1~~GHVO01044018.1.p1  ORF type:complete len:512 (+),score=100.75 GHVO01044018.1:48-1538(+)
MVRAPKPTLEKPLKKGPQKIISAPPKVAVPKQSAKIAKPKLTDDEREVYKFLTNLNEQVSEMQLAPVSEDADEAAGNTIMSGDLTEMKTRIADTVAMLSNWKAVNPLLQKLSKQRKAKVPTRAVVIEVLVRDVVVAYGYSFDMARYIFELFSPGDALAYVEACEQQRPVTLRTNTLKTRRKELARILIAKGANVDPLGDWCRVGLKVYDSNIPIGATTEHCAGHYMIQGAASLLPVMALAPIPGETVVDMAAAPGGKSTHISSLMNNTGTLFSNDVSRDRISALSANLQRLGVSNAIVINLDGKELPKYLPKVDRVLLDAPCTGSGVSTRDASVKYKRGPDSFKEMSKTQKVLLQAAVDLVNSKSTKGGIIVYSTCSISVEENEAVIDHILRTRNVVLVPTGIPFGSPGVASFKDSRFHPSIPKHTKRVFPHANNLDGFFVAKLKKTSDDIPVRIPKNRHKTNEFIKVWSKENWSDELLNHLKTPEEYEDADEDRA